MFKRYFIPAIVAVIALAACTKEMQEIGPQPAGPVASDNVHELSIGIEAGSYVLADGSTKASMEPTVRVKWEKNDAVSVVNATKGIILGGCLQATEGGTSVVFSGKVTGTIEDGDVLYYIYPRLTENQAETDFSNEGYGISLAGQTYDNETPGKVCFFGYAADQASSSSSSISKHIKFNIVTSYIHLNMSNLPAKGFTLSSIDISNINKGFKWSLSNAALTAEAFGENEGISVNCRNTKISKSGNAVVHFAIPASEAATNGRVITVNKAYKNANYTAAKREASLYYNQLYTSWTNENVNVNSAAGDKTEVTIDNLGSTETAEGILPVASSGESAFAADKPTEISLGGLGTITFNQQASAAIKTNTQYAQSTNVFFKVEDVTETKPVENVNLVYEVTMKTVDGNGVEVFSESKAAGVATVTVPLGEDVQDVTSVKLVNDSGVEIEGGVVPESVHFENGILSFQVNHFSKYAIKYTSKETPGSYVAQIGIRKYTTLANAIAAVQNGNTIEVLKDINDATGISVAQNANKNFTVDFGGYTYTCLDNPTGSTNTKNQVFQLNKGNTITFKNGTINVAETNKSKFRFIIQNYADLTLENMTLDGTNLGIDQSRYTLSNNAGNINLTGETTIKAAAENGVAFDIYYWKKYYPTAPVLTWNSTGTIKGKIEISGASFIVEKDLAITTPIRATENADGPATLTVKSGATISPAEKFGTVQTAFANANNEYKNFNEASSGVVIVNRGADLTINGAGTITSTSDAYSYAAVCLTEKGENTGADAKLTVEGNVTLEGYYFGIAGNGSRQGTDITIKGGTVKGIETNNCTGIYHPQNGKLKIEGGTIEGATGIYVKSGEVTAVTGGTIRGIGEKTAFEHENSGAQVTGDAFIVENCGYPGGTPVVAISGGAFESVHASAVSSYGYNEYPAITGFISGGLFSTKPEADLIVEGKAAVENQDESTKATYPWTIGERPNVAKIGDTEYATLKEAFAAVPENGTEATTITIINNANETFETRGAELKKGQKVILDLNGHKLVGTSTKPGYTQYIYIENGCELTVKDSQTGGAIEYHDSYIENYTSGDKTGGSTITCHGCMILKSGTIENKTPDTNTSDLEGAIDMYTNAWGQAYSPADIVLTIDGGVVKSNNANTIRMTSFSSQSYTTSVTANMNGGEVYGRDGFFIQGVSDSYLNTNTLNLNGGKVYGTQAVRVMAFQSYANASESKPVTINISKDVDMQSNYGAQSTKQYWSGGICIDNLSGTYEQLLSYVNIIGGGVCKIGGTIYPTLEAAVAAATPLAQIRLIDNCAETVTVAKNVELFTDSHNFSGKLNPAAGYYTFDKNDISILGDFSSFYPTGMDYITLAYPSAEVHDIDCSGGNIKFETNILETAYSFNAFDTQITRGDTGMTDMALMTKVLGEPNFSKLNNFDLGEFEQALGTLNDAEKNRVNEIISTMLPYLSWIADFEVHFNNDVAEGSLGVSGYYGSYAEAEGNGMGMDINAPAINCGDTYRMLYDFIGKEIPYAGICLAVRTFDCGAYRNVENVENVAGTTMTVDLCLYNSDSESEVKKIVVGTYSYTFPQANN